MCSCNQTAVFTRSQKHSAHYCIVQTRFFHTTTQLFHRTQHTRFHTFFNIHMGINANTHYMPPFFFFFRALAIVQFGCVFPHPITVQLFCFQPADETPSKQEGWTELTDWGSSTASSPPIHKLHGYPSSQSINIVFLNSHSCDFCSIHCNGTIPLKFVTTWCYTDTECTGYTQMIHTVTISTVWWFPA